MSRAFSDIAFTPTVRDMQSRMGSRANYAPLDHAEDRADELGPVEAEFIAARDGFYQATVSETGWPYVQFRGGPAGFLKVLDGRTLGYADFRGNMQDISVGNVVNNDRISIILMDYANRARLKILGRVRLVGLDDDPALMSRLELPSYRARVQRGVIITIEGYDWNCPQHITPRFTEAEIAEVTAPLREQLATLKASLDASGAKTMARPASLPVELGKGALPLRISGIRQLTPRVRAYELSHAGGGSLPPVEPGAHIDVPVRIPSMDLPGRSIDSTRRYSITSVSAGRECFEIAVLHQPDGNGGSAAVHRDYQLGTTLRCAVPGNDFPLHTDTRPAVLIAGGIGITPLRAMALKLLRAGRSVQLHYAVRSLEDAAFRDELQAYLGARMTVYAADRGVRLDAGSVVAQAAAGSVIYVCGPAMLNASVLAAARDAGIPADRLRSEPFAPAPATTAAKAIRVVLRRSDKVVDVRADQSILDAVHGAGVEAPSACRTGTCATCATKVIAGTPDHRDSALTVAEREQVGLMCICVSRAHSAHLTLDL